MASPHQATNELPSRRTSLSSAEAPSPHPHLEQSVPSTPVEDLDHDGLDSKPGGVFWFEPAHSTPSQTIIRRLESSVTSLVARNPSLRPVNPPRVVLDLLPTLSARTLLERDIIASCMRLYPRAIKIKDLSSVNGPTVKKELRNPRGMSGGLQVTLMQTQKGVKSDIQRSEDRQVKMQKENAVAIERFENAGMQRRLEERRLTKMKLDITEAKSKANGSKDRDVSSILAWYDWVGTALQYQREFLDLWKRSEGSLYETFGAVEPTMKEKHRTRRPGEDEGGGARRDRSLKDKEADVEAEAEAWADHIMSLRDADEAAHMAEEEKARASRRVLTTAKPLFNFRDEVNPAFLEGKTLKEAQEEKRKVYRERLSRDAFNSSNRPASGFSPKTLSRAKSGSPKSDDLLELDRPVSGMA